MVSPMDSKAQAAIPSAPIVFGGEKHDLLDWDASIDPPPQRPSGRVRVRINPQPKSKLPFQLDDADVLE